MILFFLISSYIYIYIYIYIYEFLYAFNSIDAYLQPLVSCRIYTTIIRLRKKDFDWFGLVSLFNGISIFAGYLMPKLFS